MNAESAELCSPFPTCFPAANFWLLHGGILWLLFLTVALEWVTFSNLSYLLSQAKKTFNVFGCLCPEFFSSGCPNWGTCPSPLHRNEKHRDLCAWDRSGTFPIVLLNTRAGRQLCAPSCCHDPCRSWHPVGKSRFGKEQPDMYEAELSASPGWLYKGKQVFWKMTEFPCWDHQWKGKGQAAGRKAGLETMVIPLKK